MSVLSGLQPEGVFKYFEEICAIPHGSRDTKKISDYLAKFATDRGLRHIQDVGGNVIIFKDASTGYENSAPVILQGHMDMVCEKDEDCDIDFSKDGLRLRLDGNIISAEGTTLGGDDGIALAYCLAILDSPKDEIPHPPLEVVFTVDEEIGMFGAADIDCSMLKGRTFLNIDSEEEGKLLVSCAGGVCAVCHIPLTYADTEERESMQDGRIMKIRVNGISGGHSGVEIHKEGANSNKVMGRILYSLSKDFDFRLLEVNGGLKDNAIPRDATALIYIGSKDIVSVSERLKAIGKILASEYRSTDKDINITWEETDADSQESILKKDVTDKVITALVNLPNGIQKLSKDIEGLVQTSLNLGVAKTIKDENGNQEFMCTFSVRSSVSTEKEEVVDKITCLMNAIGGTVTTSGDYPAWEYKEDSKLRNIMIDAYEDMYGVKPEIQAIHAGLECGLFAGKLPGLDCVSYGPQMDDIHTTQERLHVDSAIRTWEFTLEVLKRLK